MQHSALDYIHLDSEHSPLVELAIRLGYKVSFCRNEQSLERVSSHYRIDNGLGRYSEGENLVDALAFMIKRDMLSVTTPIA
jgi:hypothetical protein